MHLYINCEFAVDHFGTRSRASFFSVHSLLERDHGFVVFQAGALAGTRNVLVMCKFRLFVSDSIYASWSRFVT